jgi:hypothetical protein
VAVTGRMKLRVKKIKPHPEDSRTAQRWRENENRIVKGRKKMKKRSIAFVFYDIAKKLKEIGKIASLADNCDDGTEIAVPRIAKVGD